MANYSNYYLPDDMKYVFIDPISFFWVKKDFDSSTGDLKSILIGFTELLTKNLKKNELRLNFRSENLSLRANKPFLRLLTKNKLFEFIAPWKSSWTINPNIKNNNFFFLENPYEEYLIKCYNFESKDEIDQHLKIQADLLSQITKIIEQDIFADCKDCPDLFQTNVTRRITKTTQDE